MTTTNLADHDNQTLLPDGFRWSRAGEITIEEIIELRAASDLDIRTAAIWTNVLNASPIVTGVYAVMDGDLPDLLVSFGVVCGSWHAILCEEVTRPGFDGLGLQIAVLQERMRQADQPDSGIEFVYTHTARERDAADYATALEAMGFKQDRNYFAGTRWPTRHARK